MRLAKWPSLCLLVSVLFLLACGGGGTGTATAKVAAVAPAITTPPVAQTVVLGLPATFSVVATGSPSYQWLRNGQAIAGATSSTYRTPATVKADQGALFSVAVTWDSASLTSDGAALTVQWAPQISTPPQDQSVVAGNPATFTVVADGFPTPTVQWQRNGAVLTGATGPSYTLPVTTLADDGATFLAVLANSLSSATASASARLTVIIPTPVAITAQPQGQAILAGGSASFSVVATGTAPLTYQWYRNQVAIAGATAATLALSNAQVADAGSYTVTVNNGANLPQTSSAALLAVTPGPSRPVFTAQPTGQTVILGQQATFSAQAIGNPAPSYQWLYNGVAIPGATATLYRTPAALKADQNAVFTVVATNDLGAATSSGAGLVVQWAPTVLAHPVSQLVTVGNSATYAVTADGFPAPSVQWLRNGVAIPGATAMAYTTPATTVADQGAAFAAVLTNVVGTVQSLPATLSLGPLTPVTITGQPQGLLTGVGGSVSFTVAAVGTAPITYQWSKNQVPISGATGATCTLSNVQLGDAGSYTVVVNNAANLPQTSAPATLTVNPAPAFPAITAGPQPQTAILGQQATYSVQVSGTPAPTLQWLYNGLPIPGATAPIYHTPATTKADQGALFTVVATNDQGSVTSTGASLTVQWAPVITAQPRDLALVVGSPASFTVGVDAYPVPTVQWLRNGAVIAGATALTYTIPAASLADQGAIFTVVLANSVGTAQSLPATLTSGLLAPVAITGQPLNQAVSVGASASFSVTATGTAPLTYQWNRNQVAISGATASTYSIASAQLTDAGAYTVTVNNAANLPQTSVLASLTVIPQPARPTITAQPTGQTVILGQQATFAVQAAGSPDPTFQWLYNGVPIPGATAASYRTPATTKLDQNAVLTVVVTNDLGSVTSSGANLVVQWAPLITAQPTDQPLVVGSTATFRVVVDGFPVPTAQWSRNGAPIAGATLLSYTTPVATLADQGTIYSVALANSVGAIQSLPVLLTNGLLVPVVITTQPLGLTVSAGSSATFSVVAAGTAPLTYQWFRNGVILPSATTATLTLATTQVSDAGSYTVTVNNAANLPQTSAPAMLDVLAPAAVPEITTQPSGQTVLWKTSATFLVEAKGSPAPSFQWYKNGTVIAGANQATYTTPVVDKLDQNAVFSVVVSNKSGSVTSSGAKLVVQWAPTILVQPLGQTTVLGSTAIFSVSSEAFPVATTWQWLRNGAVISGATTATYTTPATTLADDGATYSVLLANGVGTTLSSSAALTVLSPVTITAQPQGGTVPAGGNITFSVTATGTAPLAYQWLKTGQPILGATLSSYQIIGVQLTDATSYTVIVDNPANLPRTSSQATLTVTASPVITTQPTAQTATLGQTATFSVQATGYPAPTYQWLKNGTAAPGVSNLQSYTTPATTLADQGASYTVRLTNSMGILLSDPALLTVVTPVAISTQPQGLTVAAGGNATFTVVATGTSPLNYQWLKGAQIIPGARSSSYTITGVQLTDAGSYSVIVDNAANVPQTSAAATLTVTAPPVITVQPLGQTAILGQSASFLVQATGYPAPTYLWRKNGVALTGETASTYTIASTKKADANAWITVDVSNSHGFVSSNGAALAVYWAPVITAQPADQQVISGSTTTFTVAVAADGSPAPSVQWLRNGQPISGATALAYTTPTIVPADSGSSFQVMLTNPMGGGSTLSNAATLTVGPQAAVSIIGPPKPSSQAVGEMAIFTVLATGTQPITYQWEKDGVVITGATSDTFTIPSVTLLDAGTYTVVVNNASNVPVTSPGVSELPATLTVVSQPAATKPVVSTHTQATISCGEWNQATFSVTAYGSAPLSYRWYDNGLPLSDGPLGNGTLVTGATSSTLVLSSVRSAEDTHSYFCRVTNPFGSTDSTPTVLSVLPPTSAPVIVSFTASSPVISLGDPVTLSWALSSGQTLSLDSGIGDVTGLTSKVFTPTQLGTYVFHLTATNAVGTTVSLPVTVTVAATTFQLTVNCEATAVWNLGAPALPSNSIYAAGSTVTYAYVPATGCNNLQVTNDGQPVPSQGSFFMNKNHSLRAWAQPQTVSVTALAGLGGTITPSGALVLAYGSASPTYVIAPLAGYIIDDVLVNGASVGPVGTYTFPSVNSNSTISAKFVQVQQLLVTLTGVSANIMNGAAVVGPLVTGYYRVDQPLVFSVTVLPGNNPATLLMRLDGLPLPVPYTVDMTIPHILTITATP